MNNALSYLEYLDCFNNQHTDFKYTNSGPIAKANGIWYSVNGNARGITDVRHALNEKELKEFGVKNDVEINVFW
jgi:hypothetical protein